MVLHDYCETRRAMQDPFGRLWLQSSSSSVFPFLARSIKAIYYQRPVSTSSTMQCYLVKLNEGGVAYGIERGV
jgi:hypothetical protein